MHKSSFDVGGIEVFGALQDSNAAMDTDIASKAAVVAPSGAVVQAAMTAQVAGLAGDALGADTNGQATVVARKPVSEAKLARETDGVLCQTHVGGQAMLEGIMMRGRYNWSIAVREPNGHIHTEEHDLISGRDKNSWMYKPIIRGCTALVESLGLGYRALEIATKHAFSDEMDEEDAGEQATTISASSEQPPANSASSEQLPLADASVDVPAGVPANPVSSEQLPADSAEKNTLNIPKPLMSVSMLFGLALGIALFIALPAILTNLIVGDYAEKTLLWNIIDGILRIAVFLGYIWLIGRMKDIKRMFGYHGAEHKTIHCYEHGLDLTVANARSFPTLHVRCGTAFLLMTMLIAIIVFTLVPVGPLINAMGVENSILRLVLVIISRIILMPLVAGIAYEVTVKWAGSRPKNPLVQIVLWPGLQLQRLTTSQPDDGQLECAIAAMQLVLEREEREAETKEAAKGKLIPAAGN
ncbi:MAG: DUF1385 domain-containing protein [Coriobacteriales bacterium]|jgi:uncharacterized protein YqhQ|nr:DUF1385 domain-containing protein [Coriobacteriales bacterium]